MLILYCDVGGRVSCKQGWISVEITLITLHIGKRYTQVRAAWGWEDFTIYSYLIFCLSSDSVMSFWRCSGPRMGGNSLGFVARSTPDDLQPYCAKLPLSSL